MALLFFVQSRKKVIALTSIESPRSKATTLKISAQIHTGTDHCDQVFRKDPYLLAQTGDRVLPEFLMGIPYVAYCFARKEKWRSALLVFMVILLFGILRE